MKSTLQALFKNDIRWRKIRKCSQPPCVSHLSCFLLPSFDLILLQCNDFNCCRWIVMFFKTKPHLSTISLLRAQLYTTLKIHTWGQLFLLQLHLWQQPFQGEGSPLKERKYSTALVTLLSLTQSSHATTPQQTRSNFLDTENRTET